MSTAWHDHRGGRRKYHVTETLDGESHEHYDRFDLGATLAAMRRNWQDQHVYFVIRDVETGKVVYRGYGGR